MSVPMERHSPTKRCPPIMSNRIPRKALPRPLSIISERSSVVEDEVSPDMRSPTPGWKPGHRRRPSVFHSTAEYKQSLASWKPKLAESPRRESEEPTTPSPTSPSQRRQSMFQNRLPVTPRSSEKDPPRDSRRSSRVSPPKPPKTPVFDSPEQEKETPYMYAKQNVEDEHRGQGVLAPDEGLPEEAYQQLFWTWGSPSRGPKRNAATAPVKDEARRQETLVPGENLPKEAYRKLLGTMEAESLPVGPELNAKTVLGGNGGLGRYDDLRKHLPRESPKSSPSSQPPPETARGRELGVTPGMAPETDQERERSVSPVTVIGPEDERERSMSPRPRSIMDSPTLGFYDPGSEVTARKPSPGPTTEITRETVLQPGSLGSMAALRGEMSKESLTRKPVPSTAPGASRALRKREDGPRIAMTKERLFQKTVVVIGPLPAPPRLCLLRLRSVKVKRATIDDSAPFMIEVTNPRPILPATAHARPRIAGRPLERSRTTFDVTRSTRFPGSASALPIARKALPGPSPLRPPPPIPSGDTTSTASSSGSNVARTGLRAPGTTAAVPQDLNVATSFGSSAPVPQVIVTPTSDGEGDATPRASPTTGKLRPRKSKRKSKSPSGGRKSPTGDGELGSSSSQAQNLLQPPKFEHKKRRVEDEALARRKLSKKRRRETARTDGDASSTSTIKPKERRTDISNPDGDSTVAYRDTNKGRVASETALHSTHGTATKPIEASFSRLTNPSGPSSQAARSVQPLVAHIRTTERSKHDSPRISSRPVQSRETVKHANNVDPGKATNGRKQFHEGNALPYKRSAVAEFAYANLFTLPQILGLQERHFRDDDAQFAADALWTWEQVRSTHPDHADRLVDAMIERGLPNPYRQIVGPPSLVDTSACRENDDGAPAFYGPTSSKYAYKALAFGDGATDYFTTDTELSSHATTMGWMDKDANGMFDGGQTHFPSARALACSSSVALFESGGGGGGEGAEGSPYVEASSRWLQMEGPGEGNDEKLDEFSESRDSETTLFDSEQNFAQLDGGNDDFATQRYDPGRNRVSKRLGHVDRSSRILNSSANFGDERSAHTLPLRTYERQITGSDLETDQKDDEDLFRQYGVRGESNTHTNRQSVYGLMDILKMGPEAAAAGLSARPEEGHALQDEASLRTKTSSQATSETKTSTHPTLRKKPSWLKRSSKESDEAPKSAGSGGWFHSLRSKTSRHRLGQNTSQTSTARTSLDEDEAAIAPTTLGKNVEPEFYPTPIGPAGGGFPGSFSKKRSSNEKDKTVNTQLWTSSSGGHSAEAFPELSSPTRTTTNSSRDIIPPSTPVRKHHDALDLPRSPSTSGFSWSKRSNGSTPSIRQRADSRPYAELSAPGTPPTPSIPARYASSSLPRVQKRVETDALPPPSIDFLQQRSVTTPTPDGPGRRERQPPPAIQTPGYDSGVPTLNPPGKSSRPQTPARLKLPFMSSKRDDKGVKKTPKSTFECAQFELKMPPRQCLDVQPTDDISRSGLVEYSPGEAPFEFVRTLEIKPNDRGVWGTDTNIHHVLDSTENVARKPAKKQSDEKITQPKRLKIKNFGKKLEGTSEPGQEEEQHLDAQEWYRARCASLPRQDLSNGRPAVDVIAEMDPEVMEADVNRMFQRDAEVAAAAWERTQELNTTRGNGPPIFVYGILALPDVLASVLGISHSKAIASLMTPATLEDYALLRVKETTMTAAVDVSARPGERKAEYASSARRKEVEQELGERLTLQFGPYPKREDTTMTEWFNQSQLVPYKDLQKRGAAPGTGGQVTNKLFVHGFLVFGLSCEQKRKLDRFSTNNYRPKMAWTKTWIKVPALDKSQDAPGADAPYRAEIPDSPYTESETRGQADDADHAYCKREQDDSDAQSVGSNDSAITVRRAPSASSSYSSTTTRDARADEEAKRLAAVAPVRQNQCIKFEDHDELAAVIKSRQRLIRARIAEKLEDVKTDAKDSKDKKKKFELGKKGKADKKGTRQAESRQDDAWPKELEAKEARLREHKRREDLSELREITVRAYVFAWDKDVTSLEAPSQRCVTSPFSIYQ